MALKRIITKAEFDKLPADIQNEYESDGDGYKLDVIGIEDTGALKRAKDREKELRKEAEQRAKEAEDKLKEMEGDDGRKNQDIKTLEKSWQSKLDTQKTEYETKIAKRDAALKRSLIDETAERIASKISTAPKLLIPHIKARLKADLDGEEPATKVLDATGQDSELSLDDLQKEFIANKDFSAIIIAGKASGGSPAGNRGGATNQQTNNNQDTPPTRLDKIPASELAQRIAEKKAAEADQ